MKMMSAFELTLQDAWSKDIQKGGGLSEVQSADERAQKLFLIRSHLERIVSFVNSRRFPLTSLEGGSDIAFEVEDLHRQTEIFTSSDHWDMEYPKMSFTLHKTLLHLQDISQRKLIELKSTITRYLFLNTIISTSGLTFALILTLLSLQALSPLTRLLESVRTIARTGDLKQSVKVSSSAPLEIVLLAKEYNKMLEALQLRDEKIQIQQQEILQRERLSTVGELSAQIVHEIRNPLNSISLNIDWLRSESATLSLDHSETLASIAHEIDRLFHITESYLVRARVPMSEDSKVPVKELLQEVLAFTRRECEQRNIEIETEFFAEEFYVRTERPKLKQAFLNVVKNSYESMSRGGKLKVATYQRQNSFQISFSDSGCGMNESVKRNMCRPFFSTKPQGNGLGLAITKNIVESAFGSLHLESQIGKGTTITFQFPG